jgi:hypothetical protein
VAECERTRSADSAPRARPRHGSHVRQGEAGQGLRIIGSVAWSTRPRTVSHEKFPNETTARSRLYNAGRRRATTAVAKQGPFVPPMPGLGQDEPSRRSWYSKRNVVQVLRSSVLADFYGTKRPKSLRGVLRYPHGIGIKGAGNEQKTLQIGSEFQAVQ